MTRVLLAGLGRVGLRAARQILETEGVGELLLGDRDHHRVARTARALGDTVQPSRWVPGEAIPAGVDVVASALPGVADPPVVRAAIDAGVPMASVTDEFDAIDQVCDLAADAEAAGVTVAAGCGLAPGLADVLAAHAAATFDEVDEIRVARAGWAGPTSVAALRHELRSPTIDWHEGRWRTFPRSGEELVWFPEPIGARDCRTVQLGIRLLIEAFPDVERISVAVDEPQRRVRFRRFRRRGDEGEWGAVRVEVWGRRATGRDIVVYGVIDRTAVAAGTVLAVTATGLAGLGEATIHRPGVAGLAALVEPVPFLAELARRGVRAAVFEGAPAG